MRNTVRFFKGFSLFLGLVFFSNILFANEEKADGVEQEEQHEKFNAGKFIIDHVTDKYEWHLWGPHENPTSIPLPVILYNKTNGWDVFLSSNFHHGKESYKGYALNHEGHIEREDQASFYDFSITKAVTGVLLTSVLVLLIFISVARAYTKREGQAPKGFQSLIEPLIIFVRDDIAKQSIGKKHYKRFLPLLLTLFFFIWISNFIGLIPTFPGIMGNISVTLALSAIILVITLFIGNKHYWEHILWMPGVPAWVKIFLLTPIEIIGVFQRPLVLMIRIFANIAAGHIVILSFVCLIFVFAGSSDAGGWGFSPVSMAFALFMNAMELLVAFLQAFVFTLLTAMYIGACIEDPHHEEHVDAV
jgi:F-type H+-transporting ATPase subunit a